MTPAKKVLFVEAPPLAYGSSQSLIALISSLDRRQYVPFLACNRLNPILYLAREKDITCFPLSLPGVPSENKQTLGSEKIARRARSNDAFLPIQPLGLQLRRLRDRWKFRQPISELKSAMLEVMPDIVHLNNQPSTNRFGYLTGLSIPIVQHIRDAPLTRSHYAASLARQARAVIAISRYVANDISDAYGIENITKVYNPLGEQFKYDEKLRARWRSKWGVSEDTLVLGQAGRVVEWKGVHESVRVYQRLCERRDFRLKTKLVIVGSSADQSAYETLCRNQSLQAHSEQIVFEPFTEDNIGVFSAFDCTLHPVRKPEAFGRVIVESMACRSIPIARNVGAISELIEDGVTGYLFDSEHQFEMAVLKLFEVRSELSRVRSNCELSAAKFSTRTIVPQILEVYESVLNSRGCE